MTGRDSNADATRHDILAAGREIFSQQPYSDVSGLQICNHAGVTRGALQHHFGSKLGLFMAVFEGLQHWSHPRVHRAVAPPPAMPVTAPGHNPCHRVQHLAARADGEPLAAASMSEMWTNLTRGRDASAPRFRSAASMARQPHQSTGSAPRSRRSRSKAARPATSRASTPASKSCHNRATVCTAQVRLVPITPLGPRLIHPVT